MRGVFDNIKGVTNMNLLIRPYKVTDAVQITELIKKEIGYEDVNYEMITKKLRLIQAHPDYTTLVALSDNEVIGFAGFYKGMDYEFDEDYIRVIALAVNKAYQNKDVGTKLLEEVESYATRRRINTIVLSSALDGNEAHSFYEGKGYTRKDYTFKKVIN